MALKSRHFQPPSNTTISCSSATHTFEYKIDANNWPSDIYLENILPAIVIGVAQRGAESLVMKPYNLVMLPLNFSEGHHYGN